MDFYPPVDKHLLIAGQNGSGKSELMSLWSSVYPRVVVVDFKDDWKYPVESTTVIEHPRELTRGKLQKYQHVVYNPPFGPLVQTSPEFMREADEIPQRAMHMADKDNFPIIIIYDDLAFIATESTINNVPGYMLLETTGRGQGVSSWKNVQRLHRIPIVGISETKWFATFYLNYKADRDRAKEVMSENIPWDELKKHEYSFYLCNQREEFGPVKLNFTNDERKTS